MYPITLVPPPADRQAADAQARPVLRVTRWRDPVADRPWSPSLLALCRSVLARSDRAADHTTWADKGWAPKRCAIGPTAAGRGPGALLVLETGAGATSRTARTHLWRFTLRDSMHT